LEPQDFIYFLAEKWRSSISLTQPADQHKYAYFVCINKIFLIIDWGISNASVFCVSLLLWSLVQSIIYCPTSLYFFHKTLLPNNIVLYP